jgi:hypothetical protein
MASRTGARHEAVPRVVSAIVATAVQAPKGGVVLEAFSQAIFEKLGCEL